MSLLPGTVGHAAAQAGAVADTAAVLSYLQDVLLDAAGQCLAAKRQDKAWHCCCRAAVGAAAAAGPPVCRSEEVSQPGLGHEVSCCLTVCMRTAGIGSTATGSVMLCVWCGIATAITCSGLPWWVRLPTHLPSKQL